MEKIGFWIGVSSVIMGIILLIFGNDCGLLLILLGSLSTIANKEM